MVNNMKYYISSSKLRLVINELGEEYKDLLIEKMLDDYQTTDIDSLPISQLLKQNKQFERKKYLYKMLSILGLCYSILGAFLLFFQELESSFPSEPMNILALFFIMIGLFIYFYGLIFKNTTSKTISYHPKKNDSQNSYELVSLWKELEGLMIQLSPDNISSSPSKLIQYLLENNFISSQDADSIRVLLRLRNKIIHRTTFPNVEITYKEYSSLIKNIRNIITKLNNIV